MARRSWLHSAAAGIIFAALQPALFAQWPDIPTPGVPRTPDGKPNLAAPAPRAADGKPDFSGMWGWETRTPCGSHCTDASPSWAFMDLETRVKGGIQYQPWADELVKKRKVDQAKDDPNVRCMPRGAPRIWTDDYYSRVIQVPGRLIVLTERNMQYRQIFMDGRALPADPNPTWNGYSTAKWDGDTLVVTTTGFRDDLWLDSAGNPLTNAGKLTERTSRPSFGTQRIDMTIDDPKTYKAPWSVQLNQPLVLDSELIDYYCLENEKDSGHMVGK
jgi:hypothetical protein